MHRKMWLGISKDWTHAYPLMAFSNQLTQHPIADLPTFYEIKAEDLPPFGNVNPEDCYARKIRDMPI